MWIEILLFVALLVYTFWNVLFGVRPKNYPPGRHINKFLEVKCRDLCMCMIFVLIRSFKTSNRGEFAIFGDEPTKYTHKMERNLWKCNWVEIWRL